MKKKFYECTSFGVKLAADEVEQCICCGNILCGQCYRENRVAVWFDDQ